MFYYGFDFLSEDALDDGIYKEVDISNTGRATDINFTVKKADIYEISFNLRVGSAKAKRGRKAQRRGLSRIRQRCAYEVVLPEVYGC